MAIRIGHLLRVVMDWGGLFVNSSIRQFMRKDCYTLPISIQESVTLHHHNPLPFHGAEKLRTDTSNRTDQPTPNIPQTTTSLLASLLTHRHHTSPTTLYPHFRTLDPVPRRKNVRTVVELRWAPLHCLPVCLFCGALPGWRVREGWDPMDGDDGARRWDVGEIGGQVSDGVRNSWMGRDETMGMRLWR